MQDMAGVQGRFRSFERSLFLELIMSAPIVVLNQRECMIFEAAVLGYSNLDQMAKELSPGARRMHLAQARWEAQVSAKELESIQFPVTFKPSSLH